MNNSKIREYAKLKKVFLWQIAEKLNKNDGNFSRMLRKELQYEEQKRIMGIIDVIADERG